MATNRLGQQTPASFQDRQPPLPFFSGCPNTGLRCRRIYVYHSRRIFRQWKRKHHLTQIYHFVFDRKGLSPTRHERSSHHISKPSRGPTLTTLRRQQQAISRSEKKQGIPHS